MGGATGTSAPDFPSGNWAHYGDSLTEEDWTEFLAALTGRTHFNEGWGGQNTTQIAARQGGVPALVTVMGNTIPASGGVIVSTIRNNPLSDTGTRGGTLAGVDGILTSNAGAVTFTRSSPGVEAQCPPGSVFTPATAKTHRNLHVTIWAGRNGFKIETPEHGIARTQAMIRYLTPSVKRVMVMEIPPWEGEENGTPVRATLNQHNAARAAAFPGEWLPIATWLRTAEAATAAGIDFTAEDNTDIANGLTPRSLRRDAGHLNTAGRQAIAFRVHQEAQKRGWL